MWISKKKLRELEKRIADLEQNQSQQQLSIYRLKDLQSVNLHNKDLEYKRGVNGF